MQPLRLASKVPRFLGLLSAAFLALQSAICATQSAAGGIANAETVRSAGLNTPNAPGLAPQQPPNLQRQRTDAPRGQWVRASTGYSTAADCERGRFDQLNREGGRREASMKLYLDAVSRHAAADDIAVLHHRRRRTAATMINSSRLGAYATKTFAWEVRSRRELDRCIR